MVRAMTMPGAISAAGVAPADKRVWRGEMTETVKLALPIALTQLGQIAMMTSDLALIGRLGDGAVAAAALAHTVLFTAFVLGMGLVSGGRAACRAGLWRAAAARGAARTSGSDCGRRSSSARRSPSCNCGAARCCWRSGRRARWPILRNAISTEWRGA
jgi:hypothetical protein